MESGLLQIILAGVLGATFGYYIRQNIAKKQLDTAEGKATTLIEEAEKQSKEIILNAKDKANALFEESKKKKKSVKKRLLDMKRV